MTKMSVIVAALIGCAIAFFPYRVSGQEADSSQWGQPFDGVQMSLTSTGSSLQLAFRNVGDRDATLNLGIMLANGKVQLPNRISLKFTDSNGTTRWFKFSDKRYGFVAGRVDDYIVPLRVGSTYSLRLTLDQFWCQETKEFSISLSAGNNYLTAHFEGSGANNINSDTPGIKLMNFWLGKVDSNTLMLQR